MNRAVFTFTLVARLSNPLWMLKLLFFILSIPIFCSLGSGEQEVASMLVIPLLTGATMPMLIAFMFVKDSVLNGRSLSDGEYMALLFSRPITRASYVMTKWLAGSLAVIVIWSTILCVFAIAEMVQGRPSTVLNSPYVWLNLVFNSLSLTALIVCVSSIPSGFGIVIYIVLVYGSFFCTAVSDVTLRSNHSMVLAAQLLLSVFQFIRSTVLPAIDCSDIFETLSFSWLPIVTYCSNVAIFLLLSIWILSRREFSYASE